jgi:hypothetical protein
MTMRSLAGLVVLWLRRDTMSIAPTCPQHRGFAREIGVQFDAAAPRPA